MRKILLLIFCLGLVGCATARLLNSINVGMSKAEVIKIMGNPESTSASGGKEYLSYLYQSRDVAFKVDTFFVCLVDGKVVEYGKKGDFDSTKDPTQVVKIVGDVKTDGKINIKTANDEELATKLRTLNKLLVDGLITKDEFDEQKKKMLDDYTNNKN